MGGNEIISKNIYKEEHIEKKVLESTPLLEAFGNNIYIYILIIKKEMQKL